MFRWYRNANKSPNESLDEFFLRCYGQEAYDKYVKPRKELVKAFKKTWQITIKHLDNF